MDKFGFKIEYFYYYKNKSLILLCL